MHRHVGWLFLSVACKPDKATLPTDSPETSATTHPGTDTDTVPGTQTIVCADPSARTTLGFFERKTAPGAAAAEQKLTEGGIVVADFNLDGLSDIFLARTPPEMRSLSPDGSLYSNTEQAFSGIDLAALFPDIVGGAAADYDGDGDFDLYVTLFGHPNVLLRNQGDGVAGNPLNGIFEDVTSSVMPDRDCLDDITGLNIDCYSQSAAWADMDRDGDLDLAVANYGDTPENHLDELMPPGGRKELYRNNGDGTFEDVSAMLPDSVHEAYGFHMIWMDIDEDGYPELWSVHDFGFIRPSQLIDNVAGTLSVVDVNNGLDSEFEDMGVGVGDIDGDGRADFVTTSWLNIALRKSIPGDTLNGVLYVESADALGLNIDAAKIGIKNQEFGWGAEVADFDNDTDSDVAAVFGFWSTYKNSAVNQDDELWLNDAGTFVPVGSEPQWAVADEGSERGLVATDLNQDGWVDLLKGSLTGPAIMYLSRCGEESWLEVLPRMNGMNRFAIGAKVVVQTPDGHTQTRWVSAGSSSLNSSGPPEVHFGLGDQITATVSITWPDTTVSVYEDIDAFQRISLSP